jgi:hypothetical protein
LPWGGGGADPAQAEHLADAFLVDDRGVEALAVAGEVPADAVRHLAEVRLGPLQDHRRGTGARREDDDLRVDRAAPGGDPVVQLVDVVVVHAVAAVIGAGDLLHLVQRADLRAVRDGGGQVVQQQ